jgi:hypothetical protein
VHAFVWRNSDHSVPFLDWLETSWSYAREWGHEQRGQHRNREMLVKSQSDRRKLLARMRVSAESSIQVCGNCRRVGM